MLRKYTLSARTSSGLAVMFILAIILGPGVAFADHANFGDEVMPILKKHCLECHVPGGEGYEKSGLDMRTYKGLMKGTRHGPIIVPGDAFSSNLSALIEGRAKPEIKMPHGKEGLSKWEKHMIRAWINKGALDN